MEQTNLHSILAAKEERSARIEHLLGDGSSSLVAATMNIPGPRKSSNLINRAFDLALQDLLVELGCSHLFLLHKESGLAGPYALFLIKDTIQPLQMKARLVAFENTHPIGRWLDLDVYLKKGTVLGRDELDLPRRRCFLCDEEATVCRRTAKHSLEQVCAFTEQNLQAYVQTSGIHHPNSL